MKIYGQNEDICIFWKVESPSIKIKRVALNLRGARSAVEASVSRFGSYLGLLSASGSLVVTCRGERATCKKLNLDDSYYCTLQHNTAK